VLQRSCPTSEELHRFLDREMASPELEELQGHLDSCRACQANLDAITSPDWIRDGDSNRACLPSAALQRIMARLKEISPRETSTACHLGATQLSAGSESASSVSGLLCDRLDEFRILQRLASGSQGTLYLAEDESLGRKVAVKVLHQNLLAEETSRKRFQREARLAASLNDQRIVRVYQVNSEADTPPFIVMEYVEGGSLKDRLESSRPTIRESVQWVRETALGLAVAHQAGLIHRDIKPSNLMLDRQTGAIRITDFGLALELADTNRMTQEGVLAGTPAYMSPEQLAHPEMLDFRTDIYSLGVVFYELMTGEVPFRGTLRMTLLQVAHDEPRSPRLFNDQIPVDLETVVLKAMARDPSQRFDSAKAFADELERWQQGIPILSRPSGRIEKFGRWCRRWPAVAALSATSLVLLLTLFLVLLFAYVRLEQSAQAKELDAQSAAQQRDAALTVLNQLVFELQNQFEQDLVDVDDLQKNSLQIAIDGLSRLKQLTDKEQFPESLTAEAFRKMGDILARLERIEEARDCLVRAERGFHALQLRPENRREALKGMVETLWSRHDLERDADDTETFSYWLQRATDSARNLFAFAPSEETRLILAQALYHQAQSQFDRFDGQKANQELDKVLDEIQALIAPRDIATDATPVETETFCLWLEATKLESQYYKQIAESARACEILAQALLRLEKNRISSGSWSRVLSLELTLEYLLDTLQMNDQSEDLAPIRGDALERKLMRLKEQAVGDSQRLKAGLQFLEELADRFAEDGDDEGSLYFLNHKLNLLETQLGQVPGDEFACLERAYCRFKIAEAKWMLNQPKKSVRQAFRQAIDDYRELSTRASFDEDHWYHYCDALVSAAEFEDSQGASDLHALLTEARRIRDKLATDFPGFSIALLELIDERLRELAHDPQPNAAKTQKQAPQENPL
jgi:serine/threonine protein kinase